MAKAGSIQVLVSVVTQERLAAALARIGSGDIEEMCWSPFEHPIRYIGDPDENVQAQDAYPMASLARAILRALEP